jgi:hypothetical protein
MQRGRHRWWGKRWGRQNTARTVVSVGIAVEVERKRTHASSDFIVAGGFIGDVGVQRIVLCFRISASRDRKVAGMQYCCYRIEIYRSLLYRAAKNRKSTCRRNALFLRPSEEVQRARISASQDLVLARALRMCGCTAVKIRRTRIQAACGETAILMHSMCRAFVRCAFGQAASSRVINACTWPCKRGKPAIIGSSGVLAAWK